MSLQVQHPVLNLTMCFFAIELSSLYTLEINSLSDLEFAEIFFHSVGCLSHSLSISFAVSEHLEGECEALSSWASSETCLSGWLTCIFCPRAAGVYINPVSTWLIYKTVFVGIRPKAGMWDLDSTRRTVKPMSLLMGSGKVLESGISL